MWIFAALGLGALAIHWIVKRTSSSGEPLDQRARYDLAALRCDLATAIGEAQRWFEMDLPNAAWDSISDAFAILEALKPRIDRAEWTQLQAQLLVAIPRALDAQPKATPRPKRRARRRSRHAAYS